MAPRPLSISWITQFADFDNEGNVKIFSNLKMYNGAVLGAVDLARSRGLPKEKAVSLLKQLCVNLAVDLSEDGLDTIYSAVRCELKSVQVKKTMTTQQFLSEPIPSSLFSELGIGAGGSELGNDERESAEEQVVDREDDGEDVNLKYGMRLTNLPNITSDDLNRVVLSDKRTWPNDLKEKAMRIVQAGEPELQEYPIEVTMAICEFRRMHDTKRCRRDHLNGKEKQEMSDLKEENRRLREKVKRKEDSIASLKNKFESVQTQLFEMCGRVDDVEGQDARKVVLWDKEKKAYTSRARALIMEIKSYGTSDHHVADVMKAHFQFLGCSFDRLPCASTVANVGLEMREVASAHVREMLEEAEAQNAPMCSLSDETSKGQHKLQAYIATFHDKNVNEMKYVHLGVCEVSSKAADEQLEKLRRTLRDIGGSEMEESVLGRTTGNMADRASTQGRFSDISLKVKEEVIPLLKSKWEKLSDDQRGVLCEFGSFSCQLHNMDNVTGEVLCALARHEERVKGEAANSISDSDPSVHSLIVDMSALFGARSAAKKQLVDRYAKWVHDNGYEDKVLDSFRGHRWNIQFVIARDILLRRERVLDFMKTHGKEVDDEKVSTYLKDQTMIDHLSVMAMVNQKITRVLWRCAEKQQHISNTQVYVKEMLDYLARCEKEPDVLFSETVPCMKYYSHDPLKALENLEKERECVKNELAALGIDITDGMREATVMVVDRVISYLRRVYADFVSGGKYYFDEDCDGEEKVRKDKFMEWAACVPTSNRACESFFALLDHNMRVAPTMRMERREALILFQKNATVQWLKQLSGAKLEEIMARTMRGRSAMLERSKERERDVFLRKAEKYRDEAEKMQASMMRSAVKKAAIVSKMLDVGFLRSVAQMDELLRMRDGEEKRRLLCDQLELRRVVLCQPGPRTAFSVTKGGKKLTWKELRSKMKELMEKERNDVKVCTDLDEELRGKRVTVEYADEDGKSTVYHAEIEGVVTWGEKAEPVLDLRFRSYPLPYVMTYNEFLKKKVDGTVQVFDDEEDEPLVWQKRVARED